MNRAPTLSAPVGLVPLPRPLMTGEVLDAAFRLFRAGVLRCLPYAALAVLMLELPTLYSTFKGDDFMPFRPATGIDREVPSPWAASDYQLVMLVSLLIDVALLGMLTLRLTAIARGVRPRFRTEVASALVRWPAAIFATLAALGFPALLIAALSLFNPMFPNPVLMLLGLPLLWPTALFAVALPAFWSDRLGAFAAIGRAVRVARRRTWRMVGAILATLCLVLLFYVLAAVLIGMLTPILGRADLFLIATIRSLLTLVVGAIGVPFVLAMLIVAYEDLKLRDQERRGAMS